MDANFTIRDFNEKSEFGGPIDTLKLNNIRLPSITRAQGDGNENCPCYTTAKLTNSN